jgi:hypothetical protein
MFGDRPEIYDGFREALVVGQRLEITVVDRPERPDVRG